MELRHLRYFLAVAGENHFGRAAQRLGIAQPALSIQIKALESELGAMLFCRTSRHVELTEAGELFRQEAKRTLEQAERAKMIVQRLRRGEIGKVRIGFAGNAFFAGILSTDLKQFRSDHPDVEIELREMLAHDQAEAIASSQIDVGYAPKFANAFGPEIKAQVIGSWPWLLAMSQDHALTAERLVKPHELRNDTFILYSGTGDLSGHLEAVRQMLGFEPKSVLRVGSTITVLTMVAAGIGLALVPSSVADVISKSVVYRSLERVQHRSEAVLLSRNSDTSTVVSAFVEMALRQAIARIS